MLELCVLQAARLKGRLTPEVAVACARAAVPDVERTITDLRDRGLVQGEPAVRITPEGRAHLAALLADERRTVDATALTAAYTEFDVVNVELKSVVSAWQLRDGATPNDHSDAAYDARVVDRLIDLHDRFLPLAARVAGIAPRLGGYVPRFVAAIERVRAGDHSYIARPITDSYHTVWFEFHEELIGLLGRSRAEEAAAGRAV